MKYASRLTLKLAGLSLVALFCFAPATLAQDREKYVIHAKAGGINSVSGDARVLRKGSDAPRELTTADDLAAGDSVLTGTDGRVEVLLNPGSYMRIGENASVELADASLDSLLVRLASGSVVVEATGGNGVKLAIGVKTPQAEAVIIKGGIYRFNALPDGATEVIVRKGRVLLGQEEIKGDRKVLIRGGQTEVAKLDKKQQDELDLWSKERAEELARANRRLKPRPLQTAFNSFGWYAMTARGRRNADSLGLWVFDLGTRTYCYLPSGWSGAASSPYGYGYGNLYGVRFDDYRRGTSSDQRRHSNVPQDVRGVSRAAIGNSSPGRVPQPQPVTRAPGGGGSPRGKNIQ
ncbi:MAG TPA: FecR family protein [Pyrinomonadaceae bacterium]|nr:FecR family protein [Pyrinomonadaceae bacterium]